MSTDTSTRAASAVASTTPDADDASDWRGALGRAGIAARGALYVVLGYLALQFAIGDTSSSAVSDRGAIEFVQQQPLGTVMLWVLAIGLAALALWQAVTAVTGDPVEGSEPSDRASFVGKAIAYGATATAAFAAVLGSGSGGSGSGAGGKQQAAAFLLDLPYGRWIVGAIGLGVIAYAVKAIVENVKETEFMQRLRTSTMDSSTRDGVEAAGRAGYGARGAVIALIGFGFVVAAVQHSAEQTRGLAGALVTLSQQPYGTWLLVPVALGLAGFGVFSLLEARHRRDA